MRPGGGGAKWERMFRHSSNLTIEGYDSSSASISWRVFFPRDNKRFLRRGGVAHWEGEGKKRHSDSKCFKLLTAAQPQSLNSHLLPQYFFCLVR